MNLRRTSFVVLDEADKLLEDTRMEEATMTIINRLSKHAQVSFMASSWNEKLAVKAKMILGRWAMVQFI